MQKKKINQSTILSVSKRLRRDIDERSKVSRAVPKTETFAFGVRTRLRAEPIRLRKRTRKHDGFDGVERMRITTKRFLYRNQTSFAPCALNACRFTESPILTRRSYTNPDTDEIGKRTCEHAAPDGARFTQKPNLTLFTAAVAKR